VINLAGCRISDAQKFSQLECLDILPEPLTPGLKL